MYISGTTLYSTTFSTYQHPLILPLLYTYLIFKIIIMLAVNKSTHYAVQLTVIDLDANTTPIHSCYLVDAEAPLDALATCALAHVEQEIQDNILLCPATQDLSISDQFHILAQSAGQPSPYSH